MLNTILNNLRNFPDSSCYQIRDRIYTHQELYQYTCNIYAFLKDSRSKRVIVYGHKDIYMIASFLACSMLGAAYIPIDESIPAERFRKIQALLQPDLIIDKSIENIMYGSQYEDITHISMADNDIYYIIFTSGSTGTPKGIQITYSNLKSCIYWLQKICPAHNDVILNQAAFSFDLSIADIYLSLTTNSKHYILERSTQQNYRLLFEELKKSSCTKMIITPSFADMLLLDRSFSSSLMPKLNQILFCGETLRSNTVIKLTDRFPKLQIINCYGPAECTFAVTSHIVEDTDNISIGTPKNDVNVYIVDDSLNDLPENEIGEILIAGASVGAGYIENTDKAFITYKGQQAYLTGDIGYKAEGLLYCRGRKDSQIKYKGYRIETDEIEHALNGLACITKAAVVPARNAAGTVTRIFAFVQTDRTAGDITEMLKEELPDYMLPVIRIIDAMPLTTNGKTDKNKLSELLK